MLETYLFIVFTFTCQYGRLVGCVLEGLKGGGVLGADTARTRGVLGAGPARKKGGPRCGSGKKAGSFSRHIHGLNIYVSAPRGTNYHSFAHYVSYFTRLISRQRHVITIIIDIILRSHIT